MAIRPVHGASKIRYCEQGPLPLLVTPTESGHLCSTHIACPDLPAAWCDVRALVGFKP